MGTTAPLRRPSEPLHRRVLLPLLIALSLLASSLPPLLLPPAAEAATVSPGVDGRSFEIDGNYTVDVAGNTDWVPRLAAGTVATKTDATGAGDDIFTPGSTAKEDRRADWSFSPRSGSGSDKYDLSRIYLDLDAEDTEDAWLRLGAERADGNGDAWVSFELNQHNDGPLVDGTSIPVVPTEGDLRLSYNFGGQGADRLEVLVDEWRGGGWSDVSTAAFADVFIEDTDTGTLTSPFGDTIGNREFAEASIDVSFLFDPQDGECRSFAQAWVRSRSSSSNSANTQDVVKPLDFGFDTCGQVTIQKVDDVPGKTPTGLNGAVFEIDPPFGDPYTCTTETVDGQDGRCVLEDAVPGTYTVTELAPPPGYRLPLEPGDRTQTYTLGDNELHTFTFSDPPISYRIDVTPDAAVNPVGQEHRFLVELWTDFVFDEGAGEHGEVVAESDAADIPLGGQDVTLAWSGAPGSGIVRIVDEHGSDETLADDPLTCTTREVDDPDVDDAREGTCFVDVDSSVVAQPGTLTATYDTPYDGPAAAGNTTDGTLAGSISDAGTKGWIGYVVELSDDADNPLGTAHEFTATVRVVDGGDGDPQVPDHPVTVGFDWDGPAGSGIVGAPSCTTEAGDGTCTVTVDSPDAAGSGTLSVVGLDGEVVAGEPNLVVELPTRDEAGDDEELLGLVVDATKTWWDYRVDVEPDAVNPVGETHVFTVTVERFDGTMDDDREVWVPAPEGTWLETDFPGHDGIGRVTDPSDPATPDAIGDVCADPAAGTDADGVCRVEVVSDVRGTGTLNVSGIAGTTLPGHDPDEHGDPTPFAYADVTHPDTSDHASKVWVDAIVEITDDAENPTGYAHTFTLTPKIWDEGDEAYVEVDDGTLLDLAFSDPDLVADDTCTATPGTIDGTCTVTTTAPDTAVSLTVTVVGIASTPLAGYPDGTASFTFDPEDRPASTKQWVRYRILPDVDGYNLAGDPHEFTLTVQESREPDAREDDPADDEAWSPVPVQTVLEVELADGAVSDGLSGTCLTIGTTLAGTCTVVVTSDTPGSTTVIADGLAVTLFDGEQDVSYDVEVPSAEQTKTWIEYRATLDGDAVNLTGDPHRFAVTVEQTTDPDRQRWEAAPDGTTLALDFPGGDGTGTVEDTTTCDDDGTVDGVCVVDVTSDAPGTGTLTVTGIADVEYRDGDTVLATFVDVDTGDAFTGDAADKTWVHYDVTLSDDAVNPLDQPHDFTATVTYDDGSPGAPHAAAGAVVTAEWSTTAEPLTCTTDADGTCTITVEAPAAPGTGTLTVSTIVHTYVAGALSEPFTVDFSVDAEVTDGRDPDLDGVTTSKTWRDYRAAVAEDGVNLTGDPHAFTVTIEQTDDGETWVGVPDGTTVADATWDGPVGSVDPTASTCFDDGTTDGTCVITVASDAPGEGTLTVTRITTTIDDADVETHLDGAPFDYTIDPELRTPASKTWVAIDVDLSGDAVNNVDDPHDFLATVTLDDGSTDGGLPALPGATVSGTFAWATPVGLADVAVSCETAADGTCALTVDAIGEPAEGTLTLTSVAFSLERYDGTWPFTVDLTGGDDDGHADGLTVPVTSSKVWLDYTLEVTPPDAVNLLPTEPEHTFTVRLGSSDTTAGPIAGQVVELGLASSVASITEVVDADGTAGYGPEDEPPTTCTTLDDGTCAITVTAAEPGTAQLTASYTTEVDAAAFTISDTGAKLWTTFRVRVTPDTAQNLLGTPHEFTVWVEQTDDGESWTPVSGAAPELTVTDPAFIVTTDCDDGTDDDGACTATIDSEVTGAFTLSAAYEGVVGTQSATFSDEGAKQWIDYRVTVDPATAENLVDTDHVFTVTVETDLGDGFAPVPGAIPTLTLEGPGTIVTTDCDDGTDADGTCTVTITSSQAGTSTLTASYSGSAGIDQQATETAEYAGSGDKLWVEYRIDVDPDEAINALDDPHVFTVTLERDAGDGPSPAAGAEIAVAIDGPGTITAIEDGTVDATARAGTCTTGDDGTCAVTIVSGEPGTTTLTATHDAVVGPTSATVAAEGVKQWAAISLLKEADVEPDEDGLKTLVLDEGTSEPVTYAYTITNTGPVPLDVTSLTDDVLGVIDLPEGLRLEPGASTTVTAEDVIASDVASLTNLGTVVGVADDGTEVTDTDPETVFVVEVLDVVLEPGIAIDKAAVDGVEDDGDGRLVVRVPDGGTATVGYAFEITNTGDDALTDLHLADDRIGDLSEAFEAAVLDAYGAPALPVGGSVTVLDTYEVTAEDVAAGVVVNVADVAGTGLDSGARVTDEDTASVGVVVEAEEDVEVLPSVLERALPRTGADAGLLLVVALLLATLGAAALLLTPRRRRG